MAYPEMNCLSPFSVNDGPAAQEPAWLDQIQF